MGSLLTRLYEKRWSLLTTFLVFAVLACGDGSCSGCEACGVAPIPAGYPPGERIFNAAQLRVSESGIAFLEDNFGDLATNLLGGGLDFAVPSSSGSSTGVDYTLCPDDDCMIHAEVEALDLVPQAPNVLQANLHVRFDSRDATGMTPRGIPVELDFPIFGTSTCSAEVDTTNGSRTFVGMDATITFAMETRAPRDGYTSIVVSDAMIASGQGIQDEDVDVSDCTVSFLLNLFKGTIVNSLTDKLNETLAEKLSEELCTTAGAYGCPPGTDTDGSDETAICRFAGSTECVPGLLGNNGQGDLGAALIGGVSPGAHAFAQYLFASAGQGEAQNGGLSLFFAGGFRGTDRTFSSIAHNPCVPVVTPPALPTVQRTTTLAGNTIPGGGTSHIGLGVSEQYLNYAGYGMFDSGMLCLAVGTRLSQSLSSGLFSALIGSLGNLSFPEQSAPMSLSLRPQKPPVVEIGTGTEADPILNITLPELNVDFYVWSTERYIRFLTFESDITLGINLAVEGGELVPVVGNVTAANPSVTNSDLLTEDPAALASLIETVMSMYLGDLLGGVSGFALPSVMGLEFTVPEGGIVGFEEVGDEWLGIFANLTVVPDTSAFTATASTAAELARLDLDPATLELGTLGERGLPTAHLIVDADGPLGSDYEYSYRVDGLPWSAWTQDRRIAVTHRGFLLQARHLVEVRSRVVGAAGTTDPNPARVEVLIDALPPAVFIDRTETGALVRATDLITEKEKLEVRYRLEGANVSVWETLGRELLVPLDFDDADLTVEVRDEAGNIGAAQAALIRGIPNPNAEGCACTVAGRNSKSTGPLLLTLMILALPFIRRRSRRIRSAKNGARWSFLLLVFLLGGCSCGDDKPKGPCDDLCAAAVAPVTVGSICCEPTDMCVTYDLAEMCDPGFVCSSADALVLGEGCGLTCSDCIKAPALSPGILATHLDFQKRADGSIVISGYSPGDLPRRYGDLVVGVYASDDNVAWNIVDGVPAGPITNDPDGWRGGVSSEGDDVGRWTSLVETTSGNLLVAYYDRTHGSLKVASGQPGAWSVHVVDDVGDAGRYASLAIGPSGNPALAYLRMEPTSDGTGQIKSSVRVAFASTPSPTATGDWTALEVASGTMPCRPGLCGAGVSCLEDGRCVTPTSDCVEDCASDEACVTGSCETKLDDTYIEEMPPALGMYNALQATSSGLALVYYDRTAGNLMGASFNGAAWSAPFLIDGYGADDPEAGDCGLAASLAIDSGDGWHVSYVDGSEENLRYASVSGTSVLSTEIIDNGTSDGTTPHSDGRHLVGDDSSMVVTAAGELRIVYQDATAQRTMMASRLSSGGADDWAIEVLDSDGHTGFWVEQSFGDGASAVLSFWRTNDTGGIRLISVP